MSLCDMQPRATVKCTQFKGKRLDFKDFAIQFSLKHSKIIIFI